MNFDIRWSEMSLSDVVILAYATIYVIIATLYTLKRLFVWYNKPPVRSELYMALLKEMQTENAYVWLDENGFPEMTTNWLDFHARTGSFLTRTEPVVEVHNLLSLQEHQDLLKETMKLVSDRLAKKKEEQIKAVVAFLGQTPEID